MSEKLYLSIEDCKDASRTLAKTIQDSTDRENFKGLVAILNAGVFPAYWVRKLLISQGFECPILTVDVSSYIALGDNDFKQGELTIHDKPDLPDGGKGWIFLDEISDTGETFKAMRSAYPHIQCMALVTKPKGDEVCDTAPINVPQDQWVVFPWEIDGL